MRACRHARASLLLLAWPTTQLISLLRRIQAHANNTCAFVLAVHGTDTRPSSLTHVPCCMSHTGASAKHKVSVQCSQAVGFAGTRMHAHACMQACMQVAHPHRQGSSEAGPRTSRLPQLGSSRACSRQGGGDARCWARGRRVCMRHCLLGVLWQFLRHATKRTQGIPLAHQRHSKPNRLKEQLQLLPAGHSVQPKMSHIWQGWQKAAAGVRGRAGVSAGSSRI